MQKTQLLTLLTQYDQYGGYQDPSGGLLGAGIGIGFILFSLLIYLFFGYCLYKIFKKAGRVDDAWFAFVPFLNIIVLLQIVKKPLWFIILFMIPFVSIYASWVVNDKLAKGFQKETPLWTLLLFFLGFIFIPVLAFNDDVFDGNLLVDETK